MSLSFAVSGAFKLPGAVGCAPGGVVLAWGDVNRLMAPGNPDQAVIHGYHARGTDGRISHYATLNSSPAFITEMGVVVVKITLTIEHFSNYAGESGTAEKAQRGNRTRGTGRRGRRSAKIVFF